MSDDHIGVLAETHRPVENGVDLLPVDRGMSSPVGASLLHIRRRLIGHEDPGHRWVPVHGWDIYAFPNEGLACVEDDMSKLHL